MTFLRTLAAVAALSIPTFATAAPVQWDLGPDWVLGSGGSIPVATATGSFVFDADTSVFSDLNVTVTTAVRSFPGDEEFDIIDIRTSEIGGLTVLSLAGPTRAGTAFRFAIAAELLAPLTNLGGTVFVSTLNSTGSPQLGFGDCAELSTCNDLNDTEFFVNDGIATLTGTAVEVNAVPLPASALLLMGALGGLGLTRRKTGAS